ncbi:MAG: Crp/Fnr family transcriptional regulator [Sporolactobacillus sp.]
MKNDAYMQWPKSWARTLDPATITNLHEIFRPQVFKKDAFFLQSGDPSTKIGVILSGAFRSFTTDKEGNEVTKYFYRQDEVLVSYYAYLSQAVSGYSIQAIEDSQVLITSLHQFEKMVKGNYPLLLFYKKTLDAMLIKKERHASSFTLLNGTERYQQFLANYPDLEACIKHYQLASYLGMTPVTLSRIRKKLNLIK